MNRIPAFDFDAYVTETVKRILATSFLVRVNPFVENDKVVVDNQF